MGKELLFSLSKANGDFVVTPFKGSGKGGQKRNKTMSCCRISHPESGAVAESQEERSFAQNKKIAFGRLIENPKFKAWYKIEVSKRMGILARIEAEVDKELKSVVVEVVKDGRWVKDSGSLYP